MTKSEKHCGKRRNCTFCAISSFVTVFSKSRLLQRRQKASILGKGLKTSRQKCESTYMYIVENIVAKGKIAHYVILHNYFSGRM